MILWQQPQAIGIETYANQLAKTIVKRQPIVAGIDQCKAEQLVEFTDTNVKCNLKDAIGNISLVYSHGDFSLVNILNTANGIKVIDWENGAKRNPLYDLYNYFLTESYYERTTVKMVTEINAGIMSVQERLAKSSPEIAATLATSADIYRWLYYLERLKVLVQRDMSRHNLAVIMRSIDVFTEYEQNFAKPMQN